MTVRSNCLLGDSAVSLAITTSFSRRCNGTATKTTMTTNSQGAHKGLTGVHGSRRECRRRQPDAHVAMGRRGSAGTEVFEMFKLRLERRNVRFQRA